MFGRTVSRLLVTTPLLRAQETHVWSISDDGTGHWAYLNSSEVELSRLRLGDFNGDGKSDVFIVSEGSWYVRSGGLGPWMQINTSSLSPTRLAFADLDGDKKTDVIAQWDESWHVRLGGVGVWQPWSDSDPRDVGCGVRGFQW